MKKVVIGSRAIPSNARSKNYPAGASVVRTGSGGTIINGGGGSDVDIIKSTDEKSATDKNVLSALRSIMSFLSKNDNESAKGVIDFLNGIKLNGKALDGIIQKGSSDSASDSNVFSSLRTLSEILNNNEELKKLFLSKTSPDQTEYLLKLLGGAVVEGGLTADSIEAESVDVTETISGKNLLASEKVAASNVEATETVKGSNLEATETVSGKNVNVSDKTTTLNLLVQAIAATYDLNVSNVATMMRTIVKDYVSSEIFVSGMTGEGMKLYKALNGDWNLEVDNIVVRKVMTIFELVISKIRAVNGGLVISPANGKVKSVALTTGTPAYYVLGIEGDMQFVVNDLVRCQVFTGTQVKYYWVPVSSVNGDTILVLKSDFPAGVVPAVGDDLVQMGNKTNTARQGLLYLTASEDGKPRISVLDGVNSASLDGKNKVILGCLDGITDTDFPAGSQPSGYGLWAMNVFLKGVFILRSGKTIESEISATNAAAKAAKDIADAAKSLADAASILLSDIASDNKLTPSEKQATKKELDIIISEKTKNDAAADKYGVSKSEYSAAYSSLILYLSSRLGNLETTSDIVGSTFRDRFKSYYDARTNLLNAISEKAKALADAAQQKADEAANAASAAQSKANEASAAAGASQTTASDALKGANGANALLSDIANDNKLTAQEKQQTKKEWDVITSEKVKNDASADKYGISKTAYLAAYTTLSTYIAPLLVNLSVTSDIVGATFRANFKGYYDARTDLLNAISAKSKDLADAAQQKANSASTGAADAQRDATAAGTAASTAQTTANTAVESAKTANTLLTDIASDNKLTATEKQQTKKEWDVIMSEKPLNNASAVKFSIATTTYDTAYNALNTYITPLLTNLTTTSDIVGTTFRSTFKTYYDARTNLLNAISEKAKSLADTAQTKANEASNAASTAQTKANEAATAAGTAQSTANNALSNANGANALLADIASDNKLTATEKQQAKKEWDQIVSEKPLNNASAVKFSVATSVYDSAYNALSTYITPLLANLTTTSDIVGTTFRTNFKNYYDARTNLLNAISAKAKALADEAQATVDNLKIGGRNLLLDSKRTLSSTAYNVAVFSSSRDFVVGEELMVTIKGNIPGSKLFGIWFNYSLLGGFSLKKVKEGIYSTKITVPAGTNTRTVGIYLIGNSAATDSWSFEWIKLEEGNRATDWTPAPEDLENQITSIETRFEVREGEISAKVTEVTTKAAAAATSATNAKTSETNASSSATTAGTKADEAATSANNAKSSADAAATKLTTITEKESSINQTAGQISTKVTEVTKKATEAATSAANAKTSETNAGTKAADAKKSADDAAAKLATISQKESSINQTAGSITLQVTEVTTKAGQAATSATNAANSAGTASAKATAAATSESAAANSALIARAMSSGKMLYRDPTFKEGGNGIASYNNSAGNSSSVMRIAAIAGCPSASGYCLKINNNGGASSPGWGGFTFNTPTRANAIFVIRLMAFIPVGRSINFASNATGSGGEQRWLTDNSGTGKWTEYAFKLVCGSTGSFATTAYFYLLGGTAPTAADPLTWYLSYATVFDITDAEIDYIADAASKYTTKTEHSTSITQLSDKIELKAAKTDFDALGRRVSSAETTITQHTGQISLKAEKSDVTSLGTRLNTAEQKITPDAIKSTVKSQTDSIADTAKQAAINDAATKYPTKTELSTTINQLTDKIELRATKAEFNALGTRLTSAEQKITPDAIKLTVKSQTESIVADASRRTVAWVDATGLDANKYYPVTIQLNVALGMYNIIIERILGASLGKPSWSTHSEGFSVLCRWSTNGNGWGNRSVQRTILDYTYGFTTITNPVGNIGQLTESSQEYIYVRGGSKYCITVEGAVDVPIILRTSDYTWTNSGYTRTLNVLTTVTAPAVDLLQRPTIERIKSEFTIDAGGVSILGKKIALTGMVAFSSFDSSTQNTINGKATTVQVATAKSEAISAAANDATNKVKVASDAAAAAQTTANNASTAAATANALLANIANDNKLTPSEKQQTKKEWDVIASEKPLNYASAVKFGVATATYDSAYNALSAYITPLLSNLTVTTDIVGTTFRATFKTYYDARTNLLNAISAKIKELADNAANSALTDSRNNIALRLGYTNYADMEAKAIAGQTIINGGKIRTTLIDAEAIVTNALVAKAINAERITTGNLTVVSGAMIGGLSVSGNSLSNEGHDNNAYIILRNNSKGTFAGIGENVQSSAIENARATAKFTCKGNSFGGVNKALILEASGSSYDNIALDMRGKVMTEGVVGKTVSFEIDAVWNSGRWRKANMTFTNGILTDFYYTS